MIVIYHGGCDDGFAAAWVLRRKYGDQIEEFIPARYGEDPPIEKCRGKPVTIADFSYKREPMTRLIEAAGWVRVFDHHKTARDELVRLDEEITRGTAEISRCSGTRTTWRRSCRGCRSHDRRRAFDHSMTADREEAIINLPGARLDRPGRNVLGERVGRAGP